MNEYEQQANEFLKETGTEFKAEFLKHGFHFPDDTDKRDIYEITLKRGSREFKFNFGQSIANSGFKIINKTNNKVLKYGWEDEALKYANNDLKKFKAFVFDKFRVMGCLKVTELKTPSVYDVLACLQSYEVGSFKDFCDEFGYNEDSIKAEKIYYAVLNEYNNLKLLYSDEELLKLGEIQ